MSSGHEAIKRGTFWEKLPLAGKVVLVTAGSRGIGHAIAVGLAEADCNVVLASHKLSGITSTE